MPWPKWPIVWLLGCLVVLCQPYVPLVGATDITISGTFHFRDHRGPNSVTTTGDVDTFGANSVIPSGAGTTAVATQGAITQTLAFLPFTQAPNTYASSRTFNLGLVGSWTITATDAAGSASAVTNNIPNPELLPLVTNLHVIGNGVTPIISWILPDLTGLGVDREQVRIYDFDRTVVGNIKDIIFTSTGLPVGSENFTPSPTASCTWEVITSSMFSSTIGR